MRWSAFREKQKGGASERRALRVLTAHFRAGLVAIGFAGLRALRCARMKRVCVYCGSAPGFNGAFVEAAAELGEELARRGCGVVYGGGRAGLMGALADAALGQGGEVVGIIPHGMVQREWAHRGCTQLHIVDSMHERKAMMANLADAFVVLPGGIGTLDEMCEILTWMQLDLHSKPCGLLNVAGFWDHFLAHLRQSVESGFLPASTLARLHITTNSRDLLARLQI